MNLLPKLFDVATSLGALARCSAGVLRERVCVGVGAKASTAKTPFLWFNAAGLACVVTRRYCLHAAVRPSHWVWGHEVESYASCLDYYGMGPLFLIVVDNMAPPVDPGECKCERGAMENGLDEPMCPACWRPMPGSLARVKLQLEALR